MPPKPTVDTRMALAEAEAKVKAIRDARDDLRYLKKRQAMGDADNQRSRGIYASAQAKLTRYDIWVPAQKFLKDAAIL